jgi:hypothetical protein
MNLRQFGEPASASMPSASVDPHDPPSKAEASKVEASSGPLSAALSAIALSGAVDVSIALSTVASSEETASLDVVLESKAAAESVAPLSTAVESHAGSARATSARTNRIPRICVF